MKQFEENILLKLSQTDDNKYETIKLIFERISSITKIIVLFTLNP